MSTDLEVSVHGIGAGGFGVGALPEGKVVFLPRTAPGDRVLIRVVKEKARWARGEAVEWVEEGKGRRQAPCPLYPRCDGCSLQHLEYDEQLYWKGRLVGDALRRVGGLEIEDPQVVRSPKEFHYRNKVTFTVRRLPGGRIVAGFRELGHQAKVLDVGSECLLPEERLMAVWDGLRANWGPEASLLPGGREFRVTLRDGLEGVSLSVRGGKGVGDPEALLAQVPELVSIWSERKRGGPKHLAGEKSLWVQWGEERLGLPGGGFIQVNQSAGEALYEYVLGQTGEVGGKRIIDAYCGAGVLGRALARQGGDVAGVDSDGAGTSVWSSLGSNGFSFFPGRVEDELEGLLPADVLILNPPRDGLAESIPPIMANHLPAKVIYVSCDPATLARDLKRLGGSFRVESTRSFDLFPQTAHVETVVTLSVGNGRKP